MWAVRNIFVMFPRDGLAMPGGRLDVHPFFGSLIRAFPETVDGAWMVRWSKTHIFTILCHQSINVHPCPIHVAFTILRLELSMSSLDASRCAAGFAPNGRSVHVYM